MRHIPAYILLLFLFLPAIVKAQDHKILVQQIETVFKDLRSSERNDLVKESLDTWNSSFLAESEKDSIIALFKDLQELRMMVNPDLKNFAQCVNTFCRKGEKENLTVWLSGLKEAVDAKDRKKTLVKNYLTATHPLIYDNVVFSASSHKWLARGKYIWSLMPEIKIEIKDATVICKTPKDSIFVYMTTVSFPLFSDQLEGQGGEVMWKTTGDTLTATLSHYHIDMKVSEYAADTVLFHYDKKYPAPITGRLKDNASKYTRDKNNTYPEFTSYSTDIRIDSLFRNLSFRGGILYAGLKLFGFGTEENPACVHITPNDTIHMYLYSKRFSIDTARIISGITQITIPLETGEFTHPDVSFSYLAQNHTVSVKRITEQSLQMPFRDSYHQILFDIEQITWPVDSSYMEMSMSSRSGLLKANVESLNFFNDNIYDNMQGIDDVHPLNGLHKAFLKLKSMTFTVKEYAECARKPVDQLRKQIVTLSYKDFLTFDESRDEITLKPRLFDYTMARVGKKDYDNIRFTSHPEKMQANARLDLKTLSLKVFGVEKFTISEAKDIYVIPSDKSVVMRKNRDMEFNGKLQAGMFDMFGNNLFFDYDKYAIDLTHVDSTGMYRGDKITKKRGERINSLIRNITGDIVIDKPNNKSGKNKSQGFPVFNSTKESYVYFDEPNIHNGIYKRDSFYFVIKPYVLKEINDADKFTYDFKGTLVSNIVPDIEDTLHLMPDNMLGMKYKTPENGLRLYGKGNIKSQLVLNQKGFMADGQVALNKSTFASAAITLLPDSMLAETKLLNVNKIEKQRPEAAGENVLIRYLRTTNDLQATSTAKPFTLYKERVKHAGTLFVHEDGLDASGKLELKDAQLDSKLFKLQAEHILSGRTDLKLSSFANKSIQLNTSNVRADIDLLNNKGHFVNNAETNKAEFPSNRYTCTFKSFTWYMNEAYLNIGIEDEKELLRIWKIEEERQIPDQGKNIFVSTDKATDSLTFIAPLARYNLTSGDIQCQWVNHIDLANGRFYPDQGKIFIDSQGDIKEFTNATLACERTDKTKTLTAVNLKLKGRYKFDGGGEHDYISEEKNRSTLHYSEIRVDTARNIYAKANIKPEDNFKLNDGIAYKGAIFMYSKKEQLYFKGFTGLIADDTWLKHTWLKVDTYFDNRHIKIPVEVENRDDKNQRIFNGIFLNVDKTVRPYAAFQSNRIFYNDETVIGGKGELVWSANEKRYIIRDTTVDKYYHLYYTPAENTVSGFAKLNLEMKAPGIYQNAAGNISYNAKEEQLNIDNLLYMINFQLLGKMEGVLLKDLVGHKKKNIAVDSSLTAKLYSIYGRANMPLALKQLGRSSNNVPDSLKQLFVFDSLNLSWNLKNRSYLGDGKAKIVTVREKPVDQEFNVAMELIRRRAGNEIFIYIYTDKMWYYFEYTDKILYTLSSNQEYNTILQNEKADKKLIQNKEKELLYTITLCPDSKKERFLKRIKP